MKRVKTKSTSFLIIILLKVVFLFESCSSAKPISTETSTGITSHSCGATNIHNDASLYGTLTDQEGNTYLTIKIGRQTWMAENLKVTKYRNGQNITNITDESQFNSINTGAFCVYKNNITNDCPYGKLYNWYAVSNPLGLCPSGWHVPSEAEWTTLIYFLGGKSIAGNKMKSTGNQYWASPNEKEATNSSGFSALPGGTLHSSSKSTGIRGFGYFWSSTEDSDDTLGKNIVLDYRYGDVWFTSDPKYYGMSVRCIKN